MGLLTGASAAVARVEPLAGGGALLLPECLLAAGRGARVLLAELTAPRPLRRRLRQLVPRPILPHRVRIRRRLQVLRVRRDSLPRRTRRRRDARRDDRHVGRLLRQIARRNAGQVHEVVLLIALALLLRRAEKVVIEALRERLVVLERL